MAKCLGWTDRAGEHLSATPGKLELEMDNTDDIYIQKYLLFIIKSLHDKLNKFLLFPTKLMMHLCTVPS